MLLPVFPPLASSFCYLFINFYHLNGLPRWLDDNLSITFKLTNEICLTNSRLPISSSRPGETNRNMLYTETSFQWRFYAILSIRKCLQQQPMFTTRRSFFFLVCQSSRFSLFCLPFHWKLCQLDVNKIDERHFLKLESEQFGCHARCHALLESVTVLMVGIYLITTYYRTTSPGGPASFEAEGFFLINIYFL